MSYSIEDIQTIDSGTRLKLSAAGIRTTGDLLKACGNPLGRLAASDAADLPENALLKWAHLADLMRIGGIGPQFLELLEAAGVATLEEMRATVPETLADRLCRLNAGHRLARRTPSLSVVEGWIAKAHRLTPLIT